MENYLNSEPITNMVWSGISMLKKKVLRSVLHDEQYPALLSGFQSTVKALTSFIFFLDSLHGDDPNNPYRDEIKELKLIVSSELLKPLLSDQPTENLSIFKLTQYHHVLTVKLSAGLKKVIQSIYFFDVCIAVSDVARLKGFTYADALPAEGNIITADNLCHPGINNAIGNPITLIPDSNLLFLTGANMAGKSTFMKAVGINIYLAHMGFPVAAKQMQFSVKQGIYSSINVPDNLDKGYSHFYAEVLRVKTVAEEVNSGKNLFIIFDELFKGTNVKDAYDATLEVTTAFALYNNCSFIISTHITEVGTVLQQRCSNIQMLYLPTIMEGKNPVYTYQLQPGISSDRHGMMIIENEGILELLKTE
jgi:DNA mismatch repair protein MutS